MADIPEELQNQHKSSAKYYGVPETATFWEIAKLSEDYTIEFQKTHRLLDQRKSGDQVFYFWLRLSDVPHPEPPPAQPEAPALPEPPLETPRIAPETPPLA